MRYDVHQEWCDERCHEGAGTYMFAKKEIGEYEQRNTDHITKGTHLKGWEEDMEYDTRTENTARNQFVGVDEIYKRHTCEETSEKNAQVFDNCSFHR